MNCISLLSHCAITRYQSVRRGRSNEAIQRRISGLYGILLTRHSHTQRPAGTHSLRWSAALSAFGTSGGFQNRLKIDLCGGCYLFSRAPIFKRVETSSSSIKLSQVSHASSTTYTQAMISPRQSKRPTYHHAKCQSVYTRN